MSIWETILRHLKSAGIDAVQPTKKEGECLVPYTVVKPDGTSQFKSFSSTVTYYSLMCYAPRDKFSLLEPYVDEVKLAMKSLEPMVKPTGIETPAFYDDTYKAHMISIQYRNYKRNDSL